MGGTAAYGVDVALDWPPACEAALRVASAHPGLAEHCGTPVKANVLWDGAVGRDMAFVTIPVTGPNGSATLRARVVRDRGQWVPAVLHAEVESEVFNLLTPDNAAAGIAEGTSTLHMSMDVCKDAGREHSL